MTSLVSFRSRMFTASLLAVALVFAACSTTVAPTATPGHEPTAGTEPTSSPSAATSTSTTTTTTPAVEPSATPQTLADRIAIAASDGAIYTISPDGTDRQQISTTDQAAPGSPLSPFYVWPFWSPDSRHLLLTGFTPDFSGGFESSLLRTLVAVPGSIPDLLYRDLPGTTGIGGVAHFPVWHPDSGSVALIANTGNGLSTFLVDVEEGVDIAISNGSPVYLDWSADGSHMVVHTAERLTLHTFDAAGSRTGLEQIGRGSVSYRVPKFSPSTDEYLYVDLVDDERRLLKGSISSGTTETIAEADLGNAFEWSPDGNRIAYGSGTRYGIYSQFSITSVEEGTAAVATDVPVRAFWWSPDSQKVLLATPTLQAATVTLQVMDVASGNMRTIATLDPSPEMAFVIEFFDQYAGNTQLWSPDSSRVVFSGTLRDDSASNTRVQFGDEEHEVWVFDVDGGSPPISLGRGNFGTWSPQ